MPVQRFSVINLGIGAVVPNILAGSVFEFVSRPSRVTVRAACDAIATVPPTAAVNFGSDIQCEPSPIPATGTTAVPGTAEPTRETPALADDVAEPGERIVVRLVNADSAVRDITVHVDIQPIA
jgi:hypothetical protein